MNRKSFIRQLLGTVAAVTVSKFIKVPEQDLPTYIGCVDPYNKPGIDGTMFTVRIDRNPAFDGPGEPVITYKFSPT